MDAGQLVQAFAASLSPDAGVRKQSEQFLQEAAKQPGCSLVVLQVVSQPGEPHLRQAAAVYFKNICKKRWIPKESDTVGVAPEPAVADGEKEQIRAALPQLMLGAEVPAQVRSQLSEALSLISEHDFPERWPGLLPELVQKLSTSDYGTTFGVLTAVDSMLMRYRKVYKSNTVLVELKYILDQWVAPMLSLYNVTTATIFGGAVSDPAQLRLLLSCVKHICSIFNSLCAVDLPAQIEDSLNDWFGGFLKYLSYENPALVESDREKESIVDELKGSICENLNTFVSKYDDEFQPFIEAFVNSVWQVIVNVGPEPAKDHVASCAIQFLTKVANSVHYTLFSDEAKLKAICEGVIIKNLRFRDEDQELFQENYVDYVRRDLESSDSGTRRRMACELVKALTAKFQQQATTAISGYVTVLLGEYAANPAENWKQKDCAIYLVISLVGRGITAAKGATGTNELVNVSDFFMSHIAPELGSAGGSPVLKADALKFLTIFRSQIPREVELNVLPAIIALLGAEQNVVHSYAAHCLERLLTLRDGAALRFTPADMSPHLQAVLTNIFRAFSLPDSAENDYCMKALMRVVSFVGPAIGPAAPTCVQYLAAMLMELAKNPRNPAFSHYLFETIASLIRNACAADPSAVTGIEQALFPPFQVVLQNDVVEFAPYVFQLLSQLVEVHPLPLPPAYMTIFAPLLTPMLWQRQGNVPALVRLLQAYLQKAPQEVVTGGHLQAVLGIFKQLVNSRAHDHHGFFIINAVVEFLAFSAWEQYLSHIWMTLLQRLQAARTPKFDRSFVVFVALVVCKHGLPALDVIDTIQAGLGQMVVDQVWLPAVANTDGDLERKLCTVMGARLLTALPRLLEDAGQWTRLLEALVSLLEKSAGDTGAGDDDGEEPDPREFTTAYAALANASKAESDPCPDVRDPKEHLARALGGLCASRPGVFAQRVAALTPAAQQALAVYCQNAAVAIA
mmetsp:Transcript_18430/g.59977  ORF Transcript_18430/g.59977 Transcript_18430/m.59977 type:complete len:964 (-) Transcript_18430:689-3580(-)